MRSLLIILGIAAAAAGVMAALVVTAVAAVRAHRRRLGDRARHRELEALAAAHGLKFAEGSRWEPPVQCLRLPLFRDGYGREARHAMLGHVAGQPAMVFDYERCTGTGKQPHQQLFHAALLKLPIEAPRLVIRSAQVTDALSHWLGLEPIEMESEEFNRRYRVLCEDRKFAFDFCRPVVMAALLDGDPIPALEVEGRFLLMYDGPLAPEQLGDPAMAERFLEIGRRILESIPEYVRHDRPPGSSPAS